MIPILAAAASLGLHQPLQLPAPPQGPAFLRLTSRTRQPLPVPSYPPAALAIAAASLTFRAGSRA